MTVAPTAAADPDPFIPNGDAGWCPGGNFHEQIGGGSRYCMGEAYPDGSHYGQQWARAQPKNPFSYRWAPSATCYFLNEGLTQARRPFNSDGSGGIGHSHNIAATHGLCYNIAKSAARACVYSYQ